MKFSIFIIVFLAQSLWVFSQTRRISDEEFSSSGAINLMFATNKQEAMDLAIKDINKDLPFIFIQSGEAPIVNETDIDFESKYRAYYFE